MKILILTNSIDQAKLLVEKLNLENPLIWDESIINEGVQISPNDVHYTGLTVKRTANLIANYKAKRHLVIILDMLRWSAIENILHDISILIYDHSKKRNLFYNINYTTDFTVKNASDQVTIDAIKQLIFVDNKY